MKFNEFLDFAKKEIINYYNDKYNLTLSIEEVYVVWYCKTLQNAKALLSTTVYDGMYYEITYNGDKKELYLDVYSHSENIKKEGIFFE